VRHAIESGVEFAETISRRAASPTRPLLTVGDER
jgi:hypothetical protein